MKVTITKTKKWWQIWINRKPIELIEGVDFTCNRGYVQLNKTPKKGDEINIQYECNLISY
jgi:hypothetical protein